MDENSRKSDSELAVRLTVAVGRLRARLRKESGTRSTGLSVTQLSILHRLADEGPRAITVVAAAEHITQQAASQNVTLLRTAGFVETKPSTDDRRKSVVSATSAGRELLRAALASRDAWLAAAIAEVIPEQERDDLLRATTLIERLADAKATAQP